MSPDPGGLDYRGHKVFAATKMYLSENLYTKIGESALPT